MVFAFNQSNYTVNEDGDSLEVCVQLVAGQLNTTVTVTITPQLDSDPATLDGKIV